MYMCVCGCMCVINTYLLKTKEKKENQTKGDVMKHQKCKTEKERNDEKGSCVNTKEY